MKVIALLLSLLISVRAFTPMESGRSSTSLNAIKKKAPVEKKENISIFRRVANMDLFAPKSTQNDYGARNKKDMSVGALSKKSYIPNGLSKAQYDKLRKTEQKKKAANYKRNVAKAGVFIDYTDWYIERGTDTKDSWKKSVTNGHRMAKTKYDWQGDNDQKFNK
eukprot:CAMPEP_0194131140 /NCGR_PEP_ID=MMETSP0152-20130528/1961_1 /TAXON_ID=1049557 /ORGANISM="Thalassiothrix antarctica, Strain L6-D1" /LENGTH=163 /DNA_ID=CAMNT_0038825819 /DNA_START=57 /DNA_END=548 /DNA_ORIENTATION=+